MWLDRGRAASLLGERAEGSDPVGSSRLREFLLERLSEWNAQNSASSVRIARAMVLEAPPSLQAGEVTEKGYINQRAVLMTRSTSVAALFADPAPTGVLTLGAVT
jgi:feruloyl-CoA synthase